MVWDRPRSPLSGRRPQFVKVKINVSIIFLYISDLFLFIYELEKTPRLLISTK